MKHLDFQARFMGVHCFGQSIDRVQNRANSTRFDFRAPLIGMLGQYTIRIILIFCSHKAAVIDGHEQIQVRLSARSPACRAERYIKIIPFCRRDCLDSEGMELRDPCILL
jgi:hypothetical protein